MKVIHFIFAPFFWLRDIRNFLKDIATLLRWNWVLDIRYSALSDKRKKDLVMEMLRLKRGQGKKDAAFLYEKEAAELLRVLELES